MNYIKLYKSFENVSNMNDIGYVQLSDKDWREFISKIVSFDINKIKRINSASDMEVRKTVDVVDIKFNNLNYAIININHKKAFIYEVKDEYYGIFMQNKKKADEIRLKCDQIEGLLNGINFIRSNFKK